MEGYSKKTGGAAGKGMRLASFLRVIGKYAAKYFHHFRPRNLSDFRVPVFGALSKHLDRECLSVFERGVVGTCAHRCADA